MADPPEEIDLIVRRRDLLDHLDGRPQEKPRIAETTDHSRSTVDRAIRDLEAAGLVERTADGYATTVAGRLVTARHREYHRDERAILDAGEVLGALPHDCDLPLDLVTDATTVTGSGRYWLFDHVGEMLRSADRYRAVLPRIEDSRHLRLCLARAGQDRLDAVVLAPPGPLERIAERFPDLAAGLDSTDGITVGTVDDPGYGLLWFGREPGPTTVEVVAYEGSEVAGVVRDDDPAAVAWADRRLTDLAADAEEAFRNCHGEAGSVERERADLPPTLRAQGFARVDALDDRDPGWRGASSGDAARRSTVIGVRDRLRDGQRVALLGPPSDRASVCRAVAVRWYETERGSVLYRPRDAGRPFEAVGALESVIGRDRGRTLVVVEGAMTPGASAVVDVMRATSGRGDATFLLGADPGNWSDPPDGTDARRAAFRHEQVRTVSLADD